MIQNVHKLIRKWPRNDTKIILNAPELCEHDFKMFLKWSQNDPKLLPETSLKWTQHLFKIIATCIGNRPKMKFNAPRMLLNHFGMTWTLSQNEPKMLQHVSQMIPPEPTRPKTTEHVPQCFLNYPKRFLKWTQHERKTIAACHENCPSMTLKWFQNDFKLVSACA